MFLGPFHEKWGGLLTQGESVALSRSRLPWPIRLSLLMPSRPIRSSLSRLAVWLPAPLLQSTRRKPPGGNLVPNQPGAGCPGGTQCPQLKRRGIPVQCQISAKCLKAVMEKSSFPGTEPWPSAFPVLPSDPPCTPTFHM